MRRFALLLLLAACSRGTPDLPQLDPAAYADTIEAFHRYRAGLVSGPEGWATHVGLWWLKPGINRIGTDSGMAIIRPRDRAPRVVGDVIVDGDSARFVPAARVTVVADSQPVKGPLRLRSDVEGRQSVLRTGSLVISYITRANGARRAIRIKDTLHAGRRTFANEPFFPADTAWRLTARFVRRATPDSMNVIDVLGVETRMAWPGELRFRKNGREYALQVIQQPEDHGTQLFVAFKDSTNLDETYPAMRYVYVAAPDSLGRTVLDFNQAYSPPCAFTTFATCPLPPRGNTLPLRIRAGERRYPGH